MKKILYTLFFFAFTLAQSLYGQCYQLSDGKSELCITIKPKGETYSDDTNPLNAQTAYLNPASVNWNLALGTNYQGLLDAYPSNGLVPFEKNQTYEVSVSFSTTDADIWARHPLFELQWAEILHGGSVKYNFSPRIHWQINPFNPLEYVYAYTFDYTPTRNTLNINKTEWNPEGLIINMLAIDLTTNGYTLFNSASAFIPVVTTGPVKNEIEVRDSSITPAIPNLILHDPPGDESYSSFTSNVQHCQTIGWETGSSAQVGVWAKLKVGVEVSNSILGLAEVKTKAYASVQGSFGLEISQNSSGEMERCLSTSSTFSTSGDNNAITGERGDVFIGSATMMGMGLAENVSYTANGPEVKKELVIAPLGKTRAEFAYTENYIKNSEIPRLQAIIDGNDPASTTHKTAVRQKKVWDDALAYNTTLKLRTPSSYNSFTAGSPRNESETVSTTDMNSIETTIDIEAGLAIEAGVEVAGSGISGGASMKLRTTTGFNSSSSSNSSNTITYHLNDGDQTTGGLGSDKFDVGVIHDGRYGTPAFVLTGGETSCPYEGGYKIDQPRLVFSDESQSATVYGELGQDIIVPIKICNDSKYARNYHLKLEDSSNIGLEVIMSTTALNSSVAGHRFSSVPPMSCLDQLLILRQGSISLTDFENVEIYLYACSENTTTDGATITSPVTLNAYFGEAAPAHNSPCEAVHIPSDGTIMGPYDNSRASAEALESFISPPGTGCETTDGWCMDDVIIQNSLWFTFSAPNSGEVAVSLCDLADFDSQLAVYEVANCSDASAYFLVGANDDGPLSCSTEYDSYLELSELVPGQTYYVLVDGYEGSKGNFSISVTDLSPVSSARTLDVSPTVNVYPNPTPSGFYLDTNMTFENLQLYAFTGELVMEINDEQVLSSEKILLPEGLPSGTYIGRLKGKDGPANFRLSVVK